MKIVSLVSQMKYQPKNISLLENLGEFVNINAKKMSEADVAEALKDADFAIVGSSGVEQIGEMVFKSTPKLKAISVLGAGTDFIDLEAAETAGVAVCNAQGANSRSVAEHVWGMILNLSKKITTSHNELKHNKATFVNFEGMELRGKTLGIVGFGDIGSKVAEIGLGFGMDIAYNKRNPLAENKYQYMKLPELFTNSDVIVVAVPGNKSTKGLISAELISKLHSKSILISISRESVIDEQSILQKLQTRDIFGFGFDADINEAPNPEFYKYDNVLITPHTAFYTTESELQVENVVVENLIKFTQGKIQNETTNLGKLS